MSLEAKSHSEYLRNNQDTILQKWREISERHDPSGPQSRLSYREFYDDVPVLLEVLSDYLQTSLSVQDMAAAMDAIRQHGRSRWLQRFDLEDLLRDWGRLNQAVLAVLNHYFDTCSPESVGDRAEIISRTVDFFTEATCVSAVRYNELRQEEASSEWAELKQMRVYFEEIESARRGLLSDASHDIGGSLTAISGVSQLLKHDSVGDDAAALPEFGSIIEESVAAASRVLDSLVQLAHFESGTAQLDLEQVRLRTFLLDCIEKIGSRHEIEVQFVMGETDGLKVWVDPEKLQHTIEILIDLATIYPVAEPVRIECEPREDSWAMLLHIAPKPLSDAANSEKAERRRQMDQLLLRRLSIIQKATLRLTGETVDGEVESVLLRFPLSYNVEPD